MAVTVCTNISRCYKASAQFEGCREAITEVPTIISDLCRILYYNVSCCHGDYLTDDFYWTESSSTELCSNTNNISICGRILATNSAATGGLLGYYGKSLI